MDSRNKDSVPYYSDSRLVLMIKNIAVKAGIKIIYAALLLYYTLQKDEVPYKAKAVIIGTLGYLISPIDAIPDVFAGVGYIDDFGALMMALITVSMYIDSDVKQKARQKMTGWFGSLNDELIAEVEKRL